MLVHVRDPVPYIPTGSASRLWRYTGPCAVNHRFGLTDESAGAALTFTHTLSPSQDCARSLSQAGCLSLLLSLCFLISPVFFFFCLSQLVSVHPHAVCSLSMLSFFFLSTTFTLCLSANLFSSFSSDRWLPRPSLSPLCQ